MRPGLDAATSAVLFGVPDAPSPRNRLARYFDQAASAALDLLFPPHCGACDTPLPERGNRYLCWTCAEKIGWIGVNRCRRCGDRVGLGSGVVDDCPSCRTHPPAFIKAGCAVAKYGEGPLRDLVLKMKFGSCPHLAMLFGTLLAARIVATGLSEGNPLLIPVPLTRTTFRSRTFNQAEEIAWCAAAKCGLSVEPRLLQKVRSTPPQALLSLEQRRVNLKGAFACNQRVARRCAGRSIILVDDVITTGSTISECGRVLHAAGVKNIFAASVARA
ncbi:MAG TPA: ComF family protein [Planctomycetota bacterium]|nr:ComF family protein [Planctomycetota bacterium]